MEKIHKQLSERPIFSLSKSMSRKLAKEKTVGENFLKTADVPAWYRGKSNFQREAANNLFNAIRDDSEQRTAHRVRGCLNLIGLSPMVSDKDLKFLMRLSLGNDLAFLWFLMEMHYATPGGTYNINEQLILSTIAHLDMITTLRRLDQILPQGHKCIKDMKRIALLKAEKAKTELKMKKHRAKLRRQRECTKRMPYFQPPDEIHKYGKPLASQPLNLRVKLQYYENYMNPNFVVSNESNRWYATYQLQPERRIVGHVVNERIDDVITRHYIQSHIIEPEIDMLFNSGADMRPRAVPEGPVMCTHHRYQYLAKELRKHQRILEMKQKCMKQLDAEGYKNLVRIKRMIANLEERMTKHLLEVNGRLRPQPNQTKVILIQDSFRVTEVLIDDSETECRPLKDKKSQDQSAQSQTDDKNKSSTCMKTTEPCPDNYKIGDFIMKHICTGDDCQQSITHIREKKPPPTVKQLALCCKGHPVKDADLQCYRDARLANSENANENDLHDERAASKQYFTANTNTKPYQFHYQAIYNYDFDNNNKQQERCENIIHSNYRRQRKSSNNLAYNDKKCYENNIEDPLKRKKLYTEALNFTEKNVPKLFDYTPDIMAAIEQDIFDMWKQRVAMKNLHMEREAKEEEQRNIGKVKLDIPQQKYYDCDDRKLMLRMLKAALAYMSEDPKYVLASLEDAYKLPILYEWITQRYGKRYTRKECMHAFSVSVKIFSALEKMDSLKMPVPITKELGSNLYSDYSCRNYLVKKAASIKTRYNERINEAIMAQTRIFWFAMRPYMCSSGPPRNTFFAYMPARTRNIHHFRQWTPTEYIDCRGYWELKQREARANRIIR